MIQNIHPGSGSLFFTHPGFGSATLVYQKLGTRQFLGLPDPDSLIICADPDLSQQQARK